MKITMGPIIPMNSIMKKPTILLPLLVLIMIVCNTVYFSLNRGGILNDACVSVLRTQEFTSNFISNETVTLVMNPDRSGYISFSGNMLLNGNATTLFRDIKFNYQKESDDIYKLYNIQTIKHSRDNAPDALVDSIFFSTSHEKARYMTVNKIKNSYVIGNLHSPVFMCVVK